MRDPLGLRLFQPLARNLYLHATDADRAPDRFAFLACDVLMVFREVDGHREGAAFETLDGAAHEKKS
jgi:hypothetical protein